MDADSIDVGATGAEDALVADAAAQEATAGGGRGRSGDCRNCGADLQGRHCYACGQVADDYHRPIWALLADALEGLFSLDGRFWKTVTPLLLRPGRITRNYLTGIRARYMQPFRLFLLASVTFFLAFSLSSADRFDLNPMSIDERQEAVAALEQAERDLTAAAGDAGGEEAEIALEATRQGLEAAREALDENLAELDEDPVVRASREEEDKTQMICAVRQALVPEDLGDACRRVVEELGESGDFDIQLGGLDDAPLGFRRLLARNAETAIDRPDLYVSALKTWAPRLVFVLFPVYALLLTLMHFWRRRLYVYDHVIVSLHFHSFLFLFLTILMVIGHFIGPAIPIFAFLAWSNIYLYRMHRLVYGHGRFTSALRTIVLDFLYFVVLMFSLLGLLALGLIFIA